MENVLRMVADPLSRDETGPYFNRTPSRALAQAYDPDARARLRELSE